jgi:hypothetical protein
MTHQAWEDGSRIRSLYTVLQIYAHKFIKLLEDLRTLEEECLRDVNELDAQELGRLMREVKDLCESLELNSSLKQITHMWSEFHKVTSSGVGMPYKIVGSLITELRRRIREDLEDRAFFQISIEKSNRFFKLGSDGLVPKTTADLFGEHVVLRLRSGTGDLEEACKCFVAGRNTATVFHLMRVMEAALRLLAKSLNDQSIDPNRNPSWESILRKCDDELKKKHAERCAEWQADPGFFDTATANLRAVKDAWRNPTMHVETHYDEETAIDVMNTVRAFTRHLVTKLSEPNSGAAHLS